MSRRLIVVGIVLLVGAVLALALRRLALGQGPEGARLGESPLTFLVHPLVAMGTMAIPWRYHRAIPRRDIALVG